MNYSDIQKHQEQLVKDEFYEEFKKKMKHFMSQFASVNTLNLYNTLYLPATYVVS